MLQFHDWPCSTQTKLEMQYGCPERPQRTHFSYNGKCPHNDTAWRGSSGTVQYLVYQLMGTVGKYIRGPKNAKFTQEKQNGNRLRREITPIKHVTLCLPEILEVEHFRKPSVRTHNSFQISTSCRRCHLPVCLSHCTADARQQDSSNCNWIANTTQP
jgi:hypothetical protein